jgi:hypothetical protein
MSKITYSTFERTEDSEVIIAKAERSGGRCRDDQREPNFGDRDRVLGVGGMTHRLQTQNMGEYTTTNKTGCAANSNQRQEGRRLEQMDHLSRRTTRRGNWLPSLYLCLIYGRVKTLSRRRERVRNPSDRQGTRRELTHST